MDNTFFLASIDHGISISQKQRQRSSLLVGGRNWFISLPHNRFSARMIWRKGWIKEWMIWKNGRSYGLLLNLLCSIQARPQTSSDELCLSFYEFLFYGVDFAHFLLPRNPLPAQTNTITPGYLVLFVGGWKVSFVPPFPYILSCVMCMCSSSACFGIDKQLFTRTAFTQ